MRHRNDCERGGYSSSVCEWGFAFDVPREELDIASLPGMNPSGAVQCIHDAPNGPAGPHWRRCGRCQDRAATLSTTLPKNDTPFRQRETTQESSKNSSSKPEHHTDDPAQLPWPPLDLRGALGGKAPSGALGSVQCRV